MDLLGKLSLVVRLGRLHMTQFSAITFVTASIAACEITRSPLKWRQFLTAYVFVFFCQMVAHFLGEYYDQASDKLNRHGSPLTGGSRVLTTANLNPKISLYLGWGFSAFCFIWTFSVLPSNTTTMAFAMFLFAHQYSAPPLKLNHRALGEIAASAVQNVLLPTFAAMCQSTQFRSPLDHRLSYIIWPSAFIKLALFLVLNLNDRRPDWLTDKITLPILIGEDRSIILHTMLTSAAYVFAWKTMPLSLMKILTLASSPLAFWISLQMWINRPYRYDRILALSLLHCTSIMWSILIDCICELVSRTGHLDWSLAVIVALMSFKFITSCRAFLSLGNVRSHSSISNISRPPIMICGAGIAGFISAIVLHRLKIPFVVIEQRDEEMSLDGADIALWPSAVEILRALGIPESFWNEHTQVLDCVLMKQMEDGKPLHLIDMKAVVSKTPDRFRLVSRRSLMTELKKLVPSSYFLYKTKFVGIDISDTSVPVQAIFESCHAKSKHTGSMPCRIIIGADGAYSAVRRITLPDCKITVRYCGEMCYRGVINLCTDESAQDNIKRAFDSALMGIPTGTMLITYGRGIRASVGHLTDSNHRKGYWWVKATSNLKEETPDTSCWPSSFRTIYENTAKCNLYAHEIVDSEVSRRRISSVCSVLIGDAAHPITPNMGQGACMAIEDAFVLCTNIGFYSDYMDGDTEACYQYEVSRKNHTAAIARSSYIQSKIGQISNPALVWIRNNIVYNLPKSAFVGMLRSNIFDVGHHLQLFHNQVALAEG